MGAKNSVLTVIYSKFPRNLSLDLGENFIVLLSHMDSLLPIANFISMVFESSESFGKSSNMQNFFKYFVVF